MPAAVHNTVDRLDKPSAYYQGRVSRYSPVIKSTMRPNTVVIMRGIEQNKKRKYSRDDEDDRERTPEEPEDNLKDATTLYVGNLSVKLLNLTEVGTPD